MKIKDRKAKSGTTKRRRKATRPESAEPTVVRKLKKRRRVKVKTKPKKLRQANLFNLSVFRSPKKEAKGPAFPIGDKSKFSIESLIRQVVGPAALRPVDVSIDDSAIPEASNFVEFLNSPQFLNIKGWARQNEIGVKLFSEWCPNCTDVEWFCSNPDPTKLSVPVKTSLAKFKKKVCLLEHGKCPKCKARKVDLMQSGKLPVYDELIGVAGQRASKSKMVAGMIAPYILHRYLKTPNPLATLGLLPSETLHMTFVALTYQQAEENLWHPFVGTIREAPWFRNYHAFLDSVGDRLGEELYKFKDTFLMYRHRPLRAYASGPNKRTLRGRTRLFAAIDELGWFDFEQANNKERTDAHEVYIALKRSLLTVRNAVHKVRRRQRTDLAPALMANVTSPSSLRDKAMSLLRAVPTTPGMFGFHHATWEINPDITRQDLNDEFNVTPIEAERDYGANPPLSANPFFRSQALLEAAMAYGKNACRIKTQCIKRLRDGTRYTVANFLTLAAGQEPSILALDAGSTNNSFAFSIITRFGDKIRVPVIGELIPRPGYQINFNAMYERVFKPLIRTRNVRLVVADRWQSIKLLHDIEEEFGVKVQQYSLDYDDMCLVRDHVEDGAIQLPRTEKPWTEILEYDPSQYPRFFDGSPVSHLALQMVTVVDTGKQVTKADGLTDDLWRSVALGARMALDEDVKKLLNTAPKGRAAAVAGLVTSRSRGGQSAAAAASQNGLIRGRSSARH